MAVPMAAAAALLVGLKSREERAFAARLLHWLEESGDAAKAAAEAEAGRAISKRKAAQISVKVLAVWQAAKRQGDV